MAYQPLTGGKQVELLEALRVRAEEKLQASAIYAHRLLERYGKPISTRSDAEAFLFLLREECGLSDCSIHVLMTHYCQYRGNRQLCACKLKCQRRTVLSACEIQDVVADLETNESWYTRCFSCGSVLDCGMVRSGD